jgi:hypothetical protein
VALDPGAKPRGPRSSGFQLSADCRGDSGAFAGGERALKRLHQGLSRPAAQYGNVRYLLEQEIEGREVTFILE